MAEITVQDLPVTRVHPSPLNHRRRFVESTLLELGASMKDAGQAQAVLVRPHPEKEGHYELVVGERRLRAAKLVKLKTIRAEVRDLSNVELLKLQMAENNQREDVTAIEIATGFQAMLDHGVKQKEIAESLGRPARYVRRHTTLLRLPESLQELIHESRMTVNQGLEIARYPEEARSEIATYVLEAVEKRSKDQWSPSDQVSDQMVHAGIMACTPYLRHAPWDLEDASSFEGVACSECPLRSAKVVRDAPDLDRCLSVSCWNSRLAAHSRAAIDSLTPAQRDRLLDREPDWQFRSIEAATVLEKGKERRFSAAESGAEPYWYVDHRGALRQVYGRKDVAEGFKEKGLAAAAMAFGRRDSYLNADAGAGKSDAAKAHKKRVRDVGASVAGVVEASGWDALPSALQVSILETAFRAGRQAELRELEKRRGMPKGALGASGAYQDLSSSERLALLVEFAYSPVLYTWNNTAVLATLEKFENGLKDTKGTA